MTRRRLRAAAALLPTLLLLLLPAAGCVFVRFDIDEPIDAPKVRSFTIGKTTAAEVTASLGAPVDVVQIGSRAAYEYTATSTKLTSLYLLVVTFNNKDTRSDRVWLFFDEHDVLSHAGTTFATHRTRYAMPWRDMYDPVKDREADLLRPGATQ